MSGKDKKRQKRLKAEAAGEQGRQNVPKKTIWVMLLVGILLAALLGFVPEEWWLRSDSPIKQAKVPLLTLVSASMAFATVLLTTNYFDNKHKVWAYAITGLVAWGAVFRSVHESSQTTPDSSPSGLIVALFMLLATTPLFIALIGQMRLRIPVKALPFYPFIGGVAMVALSFVLATTRAGLIMYALWGATTSDVVIALLGVSGIVLVLFALLWGIAKAHGEMARPI